MIKLLNYTKSYVNWIYTKINKALYFKLILITNYIINIFTIKISNILFSNGKER